MIERLLLATQNRGKSREFNRLLGGSGSGILVESLLDAAEGAEAMAALAEPEPYETFWENALWKAMQVVQATGIATIADDSGLSVDHLKGAPGVYSARFAERELGAPVEPEERDTRNNALLLKLMEGATDRGCEYVAVVAVALSESEYRGAWGDAAWQELVLTPEVGVAEPCYERWCLRQGLATVVVRGSWRGHVGRHARGEHGFGYDPVIVMGPNDRTVAELSAEEKNSRSHRAQAVSRLRTVLMGG